MTGYDRERAVPLIRPRWWAIGLTALAAVAAVAAACAQDQPRQIACLPLPALTERLLAKYGEQPAAEGITGNGAARLVIWANPNTGTWTAAVVVPAGTACLVGSGEGWEVAKVKHEERAS